MEGRVNTSAVYHLNTFGMLLSMHHELCHSHSKVIQFRQMEDIKLINLQLSLK